MKKRLWIGVAAAALAVGGVSAGLIGAKAAAPVNAAVGDYQSDYQLVGAGLDVGWTNTANTAYQLIEQSDGTFAWTGAFKVERFRLVKAGTWNLGLNWSSVLATSEKVADGTFVKASTIGSDSDNNIWCKTAGTYTVSLNAAKTQLSFLTPTATQYDVTEYEVVDGVLNSTAIATEKATAGVNFTPTDIAKSGYALNGWYTDSACTNAYTAKAWTAAGNLYAKYSTKVAYDVYFTASGWSNCYVYTYGGNPKEVFGAWPGTKVTAATTGVNFMGLGGLYKVTIPATCTDNMIIFNNNSGTQTGNLSLATGKTALFTSSDGSGTGDLDRAYAAKVVFDINAARVSVTAGGSILAGSYCGVSKATATSLLQEYDALNDTAKAYVAYHNNTDYTYNYSNPSGDKVDVEFSAIIAQLRLIAAGSGANYIAPTVDTNAWIFGAIAVSGLAVGGLFLALNRKRKEN
jgi:hypothetical protein